MNTHPGCYPGLYSFWGFAPSLLSIVVTARRLGLFSFGASPRLCSQHWLLHILQGYFLFRASPPYCLYCGCCTLPHLSLQFSMKGWYAAKTGWKVNRRITMAPYKCWCCEQRRAESPIRIQPRAAPWVKRFQQTCALKEQKEGERTSISLSPVALTARQLVNELTPRVLPWAIFPLGLRPVFALNRGYCTSSWVIFFLELRPVCARNIGCCTLRWAIFPLGLRPVLARNHCCCTLRWVISLSGLRPLIACIVAAARCHIYHYNLVWRGYMPQWRGWKVNRRIAHGTVQLLMLRAKTGWKPNRRITVVTYACWCCEQRRAESPIRIQPRGSALGNIEWTNLRSERAKGRNERTFRWLLLRLQRAN